MNIVKFTWRGKPVELVYGGDLEDRKAIVAVAEREGHLSKTARNNERQQFLSCFDLALCGVDSQAPIGSVIQASSKLVCKLDGATVVYQLPARLDASRACSGLKLASINRALLRIERQKDPLLAERQSITGAAVNATKAA
jgi:hypothetical protein